MRMPPPPRHGRWRAKFSTTGKPSPPSSPTPISRRQTTTPRRRCDMPSSLDASASAQEQTKGREPMPPFSASSKHAGDENSTRGRSSPKPSQTPEGASRLPCCLLPCCQPDKGEVNGYYQVDILHFCRLCSQRGWGHKKDHDNGDCQRF